MISNSPACGVYSPPCGGLEYTGLCILQALIQKIRSLRVWIWLILACFQGNFIARTAWAKSPPPPKERDVAPW